jgi:hypothetical protein
MWYYILDMSNYVISKHKTAEKQIAEFLKIAPKQRGSQMIDSVENFKKGDWFNVKT